MTTTTDTATPEPSINFVLSPSPNYALVQEQILGEIQAALAPGEYSSAPSVPFPGRVNLTLFIRQDADVLMSHGVADKNYMYRRDEDGSRLLNRFRHVLVPGAWLRDRMLASKSFDLGPDQIHAVGWPRLDFLLQAQKKWVNLPGDGRLKVLWAPSHDFARRGEQKLSTSSYPDLLKYVRKLERKFVFMTSLHPRNRKNKRPTVELLLDADVVISDFGTMVYEAWALGKPVIFPHWLIGPRIVEYLPGSAEALIFSKRIGLHADSFKEMVEMMEAGPTIGDDVRAFMDAYLDPQYLGSSARRIAAVLREIAAADRAAGGGIIRAAS